MNSSGDEQSVSGEQRAHEGEFDAQLLFPAPFSKAHAPIVTIIKRDGREVPFDKANIAETIFQAASSVGSLDRDRAESLAAGVALYLMKQLNGAPATASQVGDAVEKALIEMGHARTALAYIRYRDQRRRRRTLRGGDAHALLSEFEAVRRESVGESCRAPESLLVRTSAETLDSWNRERIVDALVRETGLEESLAGIIAFEVEQQILSAGIATLTAPLVRELVDAKLAEHGLDEHRRRHMRLGVPLHDAEQIISGLDPAGGASADPVQTDLLLAGRVKKEYALSRVFSQDVADAHLMGALHLHHLDQVDRLYGARHSPAYVQRFGAGGGQMGNRRPRSVESLICQLSQRNVMLARHFTRFNAWDAVNIHLAPFLHGADKRLISQAAYALAVDCAHAGANSASFPKTVFHLRWDVPQELRDCEAIGPGGAGAGKTYHEYRHTAKNLAWAIVEACRECAARPALSAPHVVVDVAKRFFRSQGHETFLRHASELVAAGSVRFRLMRETETGGNGNRAPIWAPSLAVAQMVSINLPRAALAAGSIDALDDELDRLASLSVAAHAQRHRFLLRLAELGEAGTLAAVAAKREGRPYLDLDKAVYYCGVAGLNECVRHLCGMELHESPDARALGGRIAERLAERCRRYGDEAALHVELAETHDSDVLQRFVHLDAARFGELAARLADNDGCPQDAAYTRGGQLAPRAEVSPIERVRMEGALHRWTGPEACTSVRVPDAETSRVAIADFIQKAYRQTGAACVVVLR